MGISVEPIGKEFAARITGIKLSEPPAADDIHEIETAIDRYAVLVFPDQDITDEEQQRFSRRFGPIEDKTGGHVTKQEDERLSAAMNDVSNLDINNQPLPRESRTRLFNLGNCLWHSDSSYRAVPAKYSMLSARAIPSGEGGNTEFADMRAAYDALDERMKQDVADLVCEQSLIYSRGSLGFDVSDEEREMFRPVRQKLVRVHPTTGRRSLFLSSHAGGIIGLLKPEALLLLQELTEHATDRRFVYSHVWRKNDLVMWDNRCTMHRARRYDETQVRDMRRTTIAGDEMTTEQAA